MYLHSVCAHVRVHISTCYALSIHISLALSIYLSVHISLSGPLSFPLFLFIYVVTWASYDSELSILLSKIIMHSDIRALNSNDPLWKRSSKWSILSGHWSGLRNSVGEEGGGRRKFGDETRKVSPATCFNTLQHMLTRVCAYCESTRPNRNNHVDKAIARSWLQHASTHCTTLQQTSTRWQQRSTRRHGNQDMSSATRCNMLQHTAAHCNKSVKAFSTCVSVVVCVALIDFV
jgi:hypothetical protein